MNLAPTATPAIANAPSTSTADDSDMESMPTSPSPSPATSPVAPYVPAPAPAPAASLSPTASLPHTHATLPLVPAHVPSAPIPMSGLLRPHRPLALPREASTILIDTATLTPQASQGPTVEQNMAFADLQRSWGGAGGDGWRDHMMGDAGRE